MKCSRSGPIARPGRNLSAPTITITAMTSSMNVGPTTGKLPDRCRRRLFHGQCLRPGPGWESISKYRPINMQNVCVQLNVVLA